MNMNDLWEDAIAVLDHLVTRNGARASLDSRASNPSVAILNRKGEKTAWLYWAGVDLGWEISAPGKTAIYIETNTHPRVLAREFHTYELDATA